jgi:hypothetical protein
VIWAFLGFLIFLVLIIFAGVRHCRKIPAEFANLASGLGMTLVRTGGPAGVGGPASPFRYGPCYAASYRDLATALFTVVDNEGGVRGTGLAFRFIRPLSLSLFSAVNIDPFTAETIPDEYRDIYLKRVDTGIVALKAWAGEKDKATVLLRGSNVYTGLERLARLVQGINSAGLPGLRRAGFMVNDHGVTLLVTEPALLNREFVEEAFLLAQVLSGSGFGKSYGSAKAESHGLKVLAMILLVLFMGFIIAVMIAGIFKVKITPVLSLWGFH